MSQKEAGMRSRRIWWLAAGVGAAAAVSCVVAVRLAGQGPALIPDPARARAIMPAVIAYLDSPSYRQVEGAYSAAEYRAGSVRWLCNATLVEVRRDGGRWRAGMDVWCGDYERHGGKVYQDDGGDMGHVAMILSGDGRYRVLSAAQEPGVSPDPAWIDRHFSDLAAAEINSSGGPMASMPDNRALLSFGCAPGAKGSVVQLPGGQGSSWAFPCRSA
jgi:hypothetical protein